MSFQDLRDTLTWPGCRVCRLKAISAKRFSVDLLWKNVNESCPRYYEIFKLR
jgi:hypothetical protein